MVTLANLLQHLFPSARVGIDYLVSVEPTGQQIVRWSSSLGPQPTAQQLADAELPCARALAVSANRAEAARRILAKYSDARQRSAALGVYPESFVTQMRQDIASVIQAENTAADLINSCTTVAQVEAVTVNWPSI